MCADTATAAILAVCRNSPCRAKEWIALITYSVQGLSFSTLMVAFCSGITTNRYWQSCSPLFCTLRIHPLPHNPPHLELHASLCRDFDWLQGLGILCSSWRLFSDFKNSKVAKLQANRFKVLCSRFKVGGIDLFLTFNLKPLNCEPGICLNGCVPALSPLCDSVHEFFFRFCCHQLILKPDSL